MGQKEICVSRRNEKNCRMLGVMLHAAVFYFRIYSVGVRFMTERKARLKCEGEE